MKVIKANPEFASELVCVIPYANWLQQNNQLEKVVTSKGMSSFYYFCDNIEERFEYRTFDINSNGLGEVPNSWIHHNTTSIFGKDHDELSEEQWFEVNGVLDYSQWMPPSYSEHYSSDEFDDLKPFIVINNNYNIEYGNDISKSLRYFDIKALYDIFNYLTDKGYTVIYKRPNNTEFALDQNEVVTLGSKVTLNANVQGLGVIDDYELCGYYDKVINLNLLKKDYTYTYNELQLRLFSSANGFITTNGGGGFLCSYFKKPVLFYVPHGKELRSGYLTKQNSYVKRLSNSDIYVVLDEGNKNDYTKLIKKMKDVF
ncbi:hypothetical protein CL614_01920 [archaeon]|nr:hypothetical protein [archaeon]|tara:strand:+ start:1426 stop:2367 length:942 start_codon:yes stop_codon:yes gene_type:complete